MKKVLSLLMVLAVVLSLFSATTVFANDNTVVVDGVTFSKNMKILVKYPAGKTDESYTIPDSVTIIESSAFSYNKYLKNIIIPNSVTSIGGRAFDGCSNLESVVLPDSVTTIGSGAFSSCTNLESVVLPKKIEVLPNSLFNSCSSLKSIVVPDGVKTIEGGAFRYCTSLESVIIPDSVTYIGSAFSGCSSLKNITLPENIGDYIDGFSECTSLESIVIPDGVHYISHSAFNGCSSLKSITIPESVTTIDDYAFSKCSSLTDIYYGATEIEWNSINVGSDNGFLEYANIHFTESDKSEIKVTLYGKKLSFDQPPVIENGRTLVPLRAIFEALNAEVAWDGETQTVRAIRYGTYIELQIGSNEMKVNNRIITLDVPAKTINDRTMVPARAIAEAFGCSVSWDAENNAVIIN